MAIGRGLGPALSLLSAVGLGGTARAQDVSETVEHGVAVGLFFSEESATYLPWFWEVSRTGAESVSLVVTWHQGGVTSTSIAPGAQSPSDEAVRAAIGDAHGLGLRVMLFPIVTLDAAGPGEWRGRLAPSDAGAWFESYRAFVIHYADIAAEEGVETFSVGSELGSMESHAELWRALIEDVRSRYRGRLLYSANWDHYQLTPFWDAVDAIGVTAYYELVQSEGYTPSRDELVSAWGPHIAAVGEVALREQRPVVITELGYTSQATAARYPWDYTAGGATDLGLQYTLYDAARVAWQDVPWLSGVYVWNWFGAGGSDDNGYTPRNKPAAAVLERWFDLDDGGAQ